MFFFPDAAGVYSTDVGAVLFGGLAPGTTTLADAYGRYLARGGICRLEPRAMAHVGSTAVAAIDRDFVLKKSRQLYPKLAPTERAEKFDHPVAEILALPLPEPGTDAWWAQRKAEKDAAYERERRRFHEWLNYVPTGDWPGYDWAEIDYYGEVIYGDRGGRHWASVTPLEVPGPPPDPGPRERNYYIPGTAQQCWDFHHRGQWRPPARLLAKRGRGRPRKYDSDAARKRAWRRRQK